MAKKKIKFDPDKDRVITFSREGEKLSEVNGELKSDFYSGIEKMCYLSDDYCAFYKGKKMGILDSKGEMITPAEWVSIKKEKSVFQVSKKNKVTKDTDYGYINTVGEELFNFAEYTGVNDVHNGRIVAESLDAGKEGAFDLDGNMVISPKFIRLGNFCNNVAVACENKGEIGIIDLFGNWVLQPEYSFISGFDSMDGVKKYCIIGKDDKYGLTDQNLTIIIEPKYDDIHDFDDTERLIVVVSSDGMQGVVDKYGNWIIPAEYDNISIYHGNRYMKLEKNYKYGLADLKGNLLIKDAKVSDLALENGLINITAYDGRVIKTLDGSTIFEGKNAKIFPNIILVSSDNENWGIINHEGKELVAQKWPLSFQVVNQLRFYDGLLPLSGDDQTIYIDEKGEIKITLDTKGWAFSNNYAIIGKKDDFSIINRDGHVVAEHIAHPINLGNGYFFCNNVEETEPQILNVQNGEKVRIPARVVGEPNNGLVKIQASDSKFGIVSVATGEVILEPVYSQILLTANGIWGYIPKVK